VERSPAIDLLLSDIVLPGSMNGRDLAGEIQRRRPAVKLLYMSGYTEGAISTLARRNGGPRLQQKPFKKADFAAAVRQALDGGEALA
jgi:DNA-binding NarL/FixJ family response regulator